MIQHTRNTCMVIVGVIVPYCRFDKVWSCTTTFHYELICQNQSNSFAVIIFDFGENVFWIWSS